MILRVGALVVFLALMVVAARLERTAQRRKLVERWGIPFRDFYRSNATTGSILVRLSVDVSGFRAGLLAAQAEVQEFGATTAQAAGVFRRAFENEEGEG